jgi:hypothetical protein
VAVNHQDSACRLRPDQKRDTQIQENILACFTKGKNINEQRKTMKEESLKGFPGSPSDHQYMKKFRFD